MAIGIYAGQTVFRPGKLYLTVRELALLRVREEKKLLDT